MKRLIKINDMSKFLKTCFLFIMSSNLWFLYSCNDDEVFDKEQYKNVFALISESDNLAKKFHFLGEESIGYISASMGGTDNTEKDVLIKIVEDPSLIDQYNRVNFDTDLTKYVKALPKSKYDIDNFEFIIPAGKINGRLPIRIRPDGLAPDSSYFIALKVASYNYYEVNPEKSYVLYRIRIKNYWAQADGNTIYNMRGKFRQQGAANELEMPGTKVMHPITKNSVRIMAGNEAYVSDVNNFNRSAIVITIHEDNNVTISPYKNIQVTQINGDPDFPNIFRVEDDGYKTFKTFLLRYNYVSGNVTYEMKEELRLEFNKDDDDKL